MSRSNYSDCIDDEWQAIRWRGAVKAAIRGKRGQKLLREMRDALDAMPVKELVSSVLVAEDGAHCALGCVGAARGIDMTKIDPEETEQVASAFDISEALAREIAFENDEGSYTVSRVNRWKHMRRWVEHQITP